MSFKWKFTRENMHVIAGKYFFRAVLIDSGKYKPHQSTRECARRVRQGLCAAIAAPTKPKILRRRRVSI